MARTKASVGAKVAAGKSNKARSCTVALSIPSTSGVSSKSSKSYSGGNTVHPRDTPKWQKPITSFYVSASGGAAASSSSHDDDNEAGPSRRNPKRNAIQSDEEDEQDVEEPPKNHALDESLALEPLDGDSSHKIDEYYASKDKGQGKKSNKENIDVNANRTTEKRDLEDVNDSEHASKRVKIS